MPKVALIIAIAVVGVGAWMFSRAEPESTAPQEADSLWIEVLDGQGFSPSVVFSCSAQGVLGVTMIAYEESPVDSAETPWGTGRHTWLENPTTPCGCPNGFSELSNCRQGMVDTGREP